MTGYLTDTDLATIEADEFNDRCHAWGYQPPSCVACGTLVAAFDLMADDDGASVHAGCLLPLNPDDIWRDERLTPEEQAIGYDLLVEDCGEEDDATLT